MSNSYIKGISVHESFNRMITLEGVTNIAMSDSVGFQITSSAIVINSSINNYFGYNLVMNIENSLTDFSEYDIASGFYLS